jgi:hypothetical protein
MRKHVAGCSICSDVVIAVRSLREESSRSIEDARVPPASLVWWRAELRSRQEASRLAERPLKLANAFAPACAIGVALALMTGMLPLFRQWLNVLTGFPQLGLLTVALAAFLVATPVALYFVFSDKS